LKRGWHEGEKRAIRRGVLVERCEKGWIEQEQVVTIVRCVGYGVSGTRTWGGPTQRYFDKDDLRNNRCPECEDRWEKEMWEVSRGKRMTRQCRACCQRANSESELSQLLFISIRQRELVRVLASLVCLLIHNSLDLCTNYPALSTKLCVTCPVM